MACLQLMYICTSYIFALVSASSCYMEHPCISVSLANTKVSFVLQLANLGDILSSHRTAAYISNVGCDTVSLS